MAATNGSIPHHRIETLEGARFWVGEHRARTGSASSGPVDCPPTKRTTVDSEEIMNRKQRLKANLAVLLDYWQGREQVSKNIWDQLAYRNCVRDLRAILSDGGRTPTSLFELLKFVDPDEVDEIARHVRQRRRLEAIQRQSRQVKTVEDTLRNEVSAVDESLVKV